MLIGVYIGIEGINVAISGVDTLELKFLQRFCSATGLKTDGAFKRATSTHLLCPSKEGTKYEHALLWGKPVVDLKWIYDFGYPPIKDDSLFEGSQHILDVTNGT